MPAQLARAQESLKRLLQQFSTGQKTVVMLAVVGLVVGGMMFSSWAGRPDYAPLFSNLDPKDAAAITDKLTSEKVPYKLSDGGGTVLVPRNAVYEQRLKMSSANLPAGGTSGYALLDKQGITTSEFRQRVDYQRALEGELVKTIQSIDGVAGASVHLVIPTQDVFAQSDQKPSASVLVQMQPGVTLGATQVQAIVNLVSSSVEGLTPQQVTVADNKGNVLNAPGQNGMDIAAGDARSSATRTMEQNLEQSSQDMLNRVLGPGHAVVRVSADLDFDKKTVTSETFDTTNASKPLSESTSKETYTGTGSVNGGVLGAGATPVTATGGQNNYSKEQATRDYAIGKITQETSNTPGTVKRLSVAVLLDSNSKGANTATVTKLVSAAVGIDSTRRDTIAVDRMPFDQTQAKQSQKDLKAAAAARSREGLFSMARTAGLIFLVVAIVVILLRSSKKSRRVGVALPAALEPTARNVLAALEAAQQHAQSQDAVLPAGIPVPAAVGAAAAPEIPALDLARIQKRAKVQEEIGGLIERQPDQVAQLLRSWLADRRG